MIGAVVVAWAVVLASPVEGAAGSPSGRAAVLPAVTRDLRAFWSFQEPEGTPRVDAVAGYSLVETNASHTTPRVNASLGLFGPYAASFHGTRLYAPRAAIPGVANISGPHATVSVVAWLKLGNLTGGAFVGGVWDESHAWRQFAIFLNRIASCPITGGLVAHISGAGGPEGANRYCESAACGTTDLADGQWHCTANVYNGSYIQAYVDGRLDDVKANRNPFKYPNPPEFPVGGIFTPPPGAGADLAVGANYVHPGGGVGPKVLANAFHGDVGGLAFYSTALSPAEVRTVCDLTRLS